MITSFIDLMLPIIVIGYLAFVFVAESFNPFRVSDIKRGGSGYARQFLRYRWGLIVALLIIVSPISLLFLPEHATGNKVVHSIRFIAPVLFALLCFYGIKCLFQLIMNWENQKDGKKDRVSRQSRQIERDLPAIVINADSDGPSTGVRCKRLIQ